MLKHTWFLALALAIALGTQCGPALAGPEVKTAIPTGAKAEAADTQVNLEQALALTRAKIEIPPAYTNFTSGINQNNGQVQITLRWATPDPYSSLNGGSLDVAVDGQNRIQSYSRYQYTRDYESIKKLPSLNQDEALAAAQKYVFHLCPEFTGQIVFTTDNSSVEYNGAYRFFFPRKVEGLPFPDNGIDLTIDGRTGELQNLNRNWTDGLVFPQASQGISPEQARAAFGQKMGLSLRYQLVYGQDGDSARLVYSLGDPSTGLSLDALTGEKAAGSRPYNPYDDPGYRSQMQQREARLYPREIELTDQEITSRLLPVQSAESLARSITELGMDSSYNLSSYSYSQVGDRYVLRMDFNYQINPQDIDPAIPPEKAIYMTQGNASLTFDARTYELINYYNYSKMEQPGQQPAYGRAEMLPVVESFLEKHKGYKLAHAQLATTPQQAAGKYDMMNPDNSTSFTYLRLENGLLFPDNKMAITFDPYSGKITNYSEEWNDLNFPATDGVLGLDQANSTLLAKAGLELKYLAFAPVGQPDPYSKDFSQSEAQLVYTLQANTPISIDARTGVPLNYYSAEPIAPTVKDTCQDMTGHPAARQVLALTAAGLLPATDTFRPDEALAQKDLMLWLTLIKGNNSLVSTAGPLQQREQDGMYLMLINDGTLDAAEKNPDQEVSREQAVMFLLRTAGYRRFAEIKNLFHPSNADSLDITPGLEGYVAIAQALGLTDGAANFYPGRAISRAEAAVMLYNYLSR